MPTDAELADAGPVYALDTSVAVPLLLAKHAAHRLVTSWAAGRTLALSGHAELETYSVLTRLPGDARLSASDAAVLIAARFGSTVRVRRRTERRLPHLLAGSGIAGGAVYDAVVALAALDNGHVLATRDARAVGTYRALGVQLVLIV